MNRPWITLVLATSITLCGCSSAETDWNKASTANTVAAYQQFLSDHPTGQHSVDAADRIHALQDDQAWTQAKQANSAESYRDYLQQHPAGTHLKEAQEAQTASQRAADWTEAQRKGTVASIQDFLTKYPSGAEADQARAKLSTLTGYEIELASAKTQKLAEKERDHLRSKYGNILHDVVVFPANSGKSYRLKSAPMSQTEADSACSELKKAHQSCEVIKREASKS
jgi:outer membrane protein assembly factor BamD (BamD/ComL family)